MKTLKYILLTLLTAYTTMSMAGELKSRNSGEATLNPLSERIAMAPVTPAEATFEDVITYSYTINLLPYVPEFAEFEDGLPEPVVPETSYKSLAPEIPAEATFDDSTDEYTPEFLKSLSPSVPSEATFED